VKKKISLVTPCFNEEDNAHAIYTAVKKVMSAKPEYDYEHIFIDNHSSDKTVSILKQIATEDKNVKIIVNLRNFGHIRSPYYGLLQSTGDATILIVADLQDPPELINEFISNWEKGSKIVVGVKNESKESFLMFAIRKNFYNLINRLSDTKLIKNYTGFGLYDKQVIDILKTIDDPYPYFRGLVCDIGFEIVKIPYVQPQRFRGITKNNFYTLYDIAMLGITNHSKVPLRLATMVGFVASLLSLLVALVYFVYKLFYWDSFTLGSAPLIIGVFLFSAVQLMFIGIIGEYVGSIHTQVLKRPLVIEKERVNF
jgi:glycosyltransferase involved in cell wall biosynthesis